MPKGDLGLVLPDADSVMIQHFHQSGRAYHGGMGSVPLPWHEIESYSSCVNLSVWEKKTLRAMSERYCSGLNKYKDYYHIPPGWTKQQAIERMQQMPLEEEPR